jgi:5-methyltetrahydrofolate--homocysteine methyltransferase
MLLNRHLGIKGPTVKKLMEMKNNSSLRSELLKTDPKGLAIWDSVEELKKTYRNSPIMEPRAVWRFFRCYSENNKIHLGLNSENGAPFSREILFDFPREATGDRLCISDFCDPDPEREDNLALFVVTVGRGVREAAEELKNSGEYLKSHILQALALESAEGYAELLHSQIRRMWGNADSPDMSMLERFQAKYSGKRYSFGYPACPELSDQRKLFKALAPEEIGVSLTEGDMMDPEASVSAIVFHHPQSRYFSVNTGSTKTDANVDF